MTKASEREMRDESISSITARRACQTMSQTTLEFPQIWRRIGLSRHETLDIVLQRPGDQTKRGKAPRADPLLRMMDCVPDLGEFCTRRIADELKREVHLFRRQHSCPLRQFERRECVQQLVTDFRRREDCDEESERISKRGWARHT